MERTQECEVHLNRRGINSIEVPSEVEVEPGTLLKIQLINHGSPLHITLSSPNSGMFTDFFHENLYLEKEQQYQIAIKEEAYTGYFDIEVITGYGTKRSPFRVMVRKFAEHEEREEEPEPIPQIRKTSGIPYLLIILLIVAAAGYAGWIIGGDDTLNYAAFLVLIIGVIVAWFSRR